MIKSSSAFNVRGGDPMLFIMAMSVLVTAVLAFIMIAETSED
ncbi:hypothetical protein [Psychrobacillus psychrodurans]|nr:hypothetical protein [Psychrobacillus psychrodurans]